MKVLVTGAAGQLGTDVVATCTAQGDDVVAYDRASLDITNATAVQQAILKAAPEVIVNCAAWTAVDACEADPATALAVNGDAVGLLAETAGEVGARLVHVSTDYVFDGTKTSPYVEDDVPNPQSVYGTSKLAGETNALVHGATVVRTSWVNSAHGANMVETILRLAGTRPKLQFVSDQRGHPTFSADLAVALRAIAVDQVSGIMHVTNAGAVSWFEFAQAVLDVAGLDRAMVEPIATADLDPPRPAPRPANSVLSNDRYLSLGYKPLRDFRDALAEVVPAYVRG